MTEPKPQKAIVKAVNMRMPVRSTAALKAILNQMQDDLAKAIPPSAKISVEQLISAGIVAANNNAKILACDFGSVLGSIYKAARFGLDCSGALRSAWLVPFKGQCQLIIGYGGFLDLARRAAPDIDIDSQLVYEGEEVQIFAGSEPRIVHPLKLDIDRVPEKIVGAYMVATPRGGKCKIEWMPIAEVQRLAARCSKAYGQGPWQTDLGEMVRKTVFRRGVKWIPISVVEAGRVLAEAESHDNAVMGVVRKAPDPEENRQRTEAMRQQLQSPPQPAEPPEPEPAPEMTEDGHVIPDYVGRENHDEATV